MVQEIFDTAKKHYADKVAEEYTGMLFDPAFKTPEFYYYYPYIFSNVFEIKDKEKLNILSVAGALLYKNTILSDKIIDQEKGIDIDGKYVMTSNFCLEESVLHLSRLFDSQSAFWQYWYQRKAEYYKSITQNAKDAVVINSYRDIYALFDTKSALGKLAIDALHIMSKQRYGDVHNDILITHKHFSIAFQIYDDIKDYKKDAQSKQFNIADHQLGLFLSKNKVNVSEEDYVKKERLVYTSGVAASLYKLAERNLGIAYNIASAYGMDVWKKIIKEYAILIESYRSVQHIYLKTLNAKVENSQEPAAKPLIRYTAKHTVQAIEKACVFIRSKQQTAGEWEDYVTAGGIATFWTTGLVLSNCNAEMVGQKSINKAISFLESKRRALWSYNFKWPNDADSSNFALIGLAQNGYEKPEEIERLLLYQNPDGGMPTYHVSQVDELMERMRQKEDVKQYRGWYSSHNCVSAVTLYLLVAYYPSFQKNIDKIIDYFTGQIDQQQTIQPYWWESDIYVLHYLTKANEILKHKKIGEYIAGRIQYNIKNALAYTNRQVYLGLLLQSAISLKEDVNSKELNHLAKQLLRHQMSDGSWKESNAMRLPFYNNEHPQSAKWEVSEYGLNILAPEFNRLHTTSVITNSLVKYIS